MASDTVQSAQATAPQRGDAPPYWQDAQAHLSAADPVMAGFIQRYQDEVLEARGEAFHTLARSIVGQQISVKAADAVWGRVVQCALGACADNPLDAHLQRQDVAQLDDQQLRSCGLSKQKVVYLRAISDYFSQPRDFASMDDAALMASLISIKGVGVWTAEMFMMFHLLRPDVLPLGDIGLLKAVGLHYLGHDGKASKAEAEEIGAVWRPYRSVATWYLWRSLDPVPVAY